MVKQDFFEKFCANESSKTDLIIMSFVHRICLHDVLKVKVCEISFCTRRTSQTYLLAFIPFFLIITMWSMQEREWYSLIHPQSQNLRSNYTLSCFFPRLICDIIHLSWWLAHSNPHKLYQAEPWKSKKFIQYRSQIIRARPMKCSRWSVLATSPTTPILQLTRPS